MGLNISLAPDILFSIAGFPITNTMVWTTVIVLFLIVIFGSVTRSMKLVPGGLQNLLEVLVGGAYDFTRTIAITEKKTKRVFPLVFTMFIFVLVANLVVYIPGQSALTIDTGQGVVPLFRSIMSDYGLVLAMTIISIITIQIVAIATVGPFKYVGRFLNFRSPLKAFLGIMELVGEVAKIVSLSFRLFGNIFAGEVLTIVMLSLAPFFVPLPFMFLGLLTAVVQAFVFSVLTLIFINMASEIHEEEA